MSNRKELEHQLDKLPPEPYKPTADLRELHSLFHKAAEIDESAPRSIYSLNTEEEILGFREPIEPTNLEIALKLLGLVQKEVFYAHCPNGSDLVLKLALRIYLDHNPPDKTDHSF